MRQDDALNLLKLGENVFLTGAAGAGKTYLLNRYMQYLREHGVALAVTASTGIAATHLNGRTLHSWSGMGVRDMLTDADIEKLLRNKRVKRNYQNVKVLIVDEISMLHPQQLDMLDTIARRMLERNKPFGGLQMVLCGDFFQLPPVMRASGNPSQRFAFCAKAWQSGQFRICYLQEQHRQGNDPLLAVLNQIRSGHAGEAAKVPLRTRYKQAPQGSTRPTRLYARNINVDAINHQELAAIDVPEKQFVMESTGLAGLVNGLIKTCLAPELLCLKKGAEVMFVKNALDGAYVNGTRGRVEAFDVEEGWPQVRCLNGDMITVTPAEWKQEDNGIVRATIRQLPLRLAWAITIHKSQGMTLDAAEMDLSDAFEPGMGYVALSRVRGLQGLTLMGLNDTALQVHADVLEQDASFRQQSEQALTDLRSIDHIKERQQAVLIQRFEGSLEQAQTHKQERRGRAILQRVATHELTLQMVKEKIPVTEIAQKRKLTLGTIITHLEKIKGLNKLPDIDYLKPALPAEEFKQLQQMLRDSQDGKLKPIYEKWAGRYSYETLRLIRLFAW